MVEIRKNNNQMQESNPNGTPNTITTSMILEDLENGVDRTGIKTKYDLETWEVKQMFDHPMLKGKKAKRVKKLSFNFVDDITMNSSDPGQVDLEDAIEIAIEEGVVTADEDGLSLDKNNDIDLSDPINQDKMHDALIDNAVVKSDPENMSKDELIEHEQETDEDTHDEYEEEDEDEEIEY